MSYLHFRNHEIYYSLLAVRQNDRTALGFYFLPSAIVGFLALVLIATNTAHAVTVPMGKSAIAALKSGLPLPKRNPKRKPVRVIAQKKALKNAQTPVVKATVSFANQARKPVLPSALKVLDPVLKSDLPDDKAQWLKKVFELVESKKYDEALTSISEMKTPIHRDIGLWYFLRKTPETSKDIYYHISDFVERRSDWPSAGYLRKKRELAFMAFDRQADETLAFFKKTPPKTTNGKLKAARTYIESGEEAKAVKIIRSLWRSTPLGRKKGKKFIQDFKGYLTPGDHKTRSSYFYFQNRRSNVKFALQASPFLKGDDKKIADVQRAFVLKRRNAAKLYDALPEKLKKFYPLQFNRSVWLRRRKRETEAWKVLAKYKLDSKNAALFRSKDWRERRYQVRTALNKHYYVEATKIVDTFHKSSATAESRFFEGWINLRFQKDIKKALAGFKKFRTIAITRRDKARAEYWLARTHEKLGDKIAASVHYTNSASYLHTFYGILSGQKLGHIVGPQLVKVSPATYSENQKKKFLGNSLVQAAIVSGQAGFTDSQRRFLNHLSWRLSSEEEMQMLLELANQIAPSHNLVKLGKVGLYRGFNLAPYGFPLNILPSHSPLSERPVPSDFVHALIRQESEFNPVIKSPAGARGLMQLMPGTAREIARRHNVRYSRGKLTSDPEYNLAIGTTFLGNLLDKYNDSYLLTLVAYNAGPGRARNWQKGFGDPRHPDIDVVDWVERIPFNETRKYVKRIMTNLLTYRQRMGMSEKLQLKKALKGNYIPKPVVLDVPLPASAPSLVQSR